MACDQSAKFAIALLMTMYAHAMAKAEEKAAEETAEITAAAPRQAAVALSDGTLIEAAEISAREDLLVSVLPENSKQRLEIPFAEIIRLGQYVIAEGLEPEWRWREGGNEAKVYSGRAYPWRKYGIEVKTVSGEIKRGTLARGFALRGRYRCSAAEDSVAPKPAERLAEATWLIQPKAKGEAGQDPAELIYVKEIRFISPAKGEKSAAAEPAATRAEEKNE